MTRRTSRAASVLAASGLVATGVVLAETVRSIDSVFSAVAAALRNFWLRDLLPFLQFFDGALTRVWEAMLSSVSFVGPNPYLQTLVLTVILGFVVAAVFVFLAVVAGPLSGRWRGPNRLEPPEPQSSEPRADTVAPPTAGGISGMEEGLDIPLTAENRSKLLHTAGALRETIRARPVHERDRYEIDLLRAEVLVVMNRLTEAFAVLDRISRAVAYDGTPEPSGGHSGRPERWTGSAGAAERRIGGPAANEPWPGPATEAELGAAGAATDERWTGAPASKPASRPPSIAGDATG